jgi:hypothetical protein
MAIQNDEDLMVPNGINFVDVDVHVVVDVDGCFGFDGDRVAGCSILEFTGRFTDSEEFPPRFTSHDKMLDKAIA